MGDTYAGFKTASRASALLHGPCAANGIEQARQNLKQVDHLDLQGLNIGLFADFPD
jgi:hypothetical protein